MARGYFAQLVYDRAHFHQDEKNKEKARQSRMRDDFKAFCNNWLKGAVADADAGLQETFGEARAFLHLSPEGLDATIRLSYAPKYAAGGGRAQEIKIAGSDGFSMYIDDPGDVTENISYGNAEEELRIAFGKSIDAYTKKLVDGA